MDQDVQKVIDNANAVIKEAEEMLASGPLLKIEKSDTLVMEYFPLPIETLSFDFMYRFVKPIEMVWQKDGAVTMASLQLTNHNLGKSIAEFGLEKFKDLIAQETKDQDLPEDLAWLKTIEKVEIHECKMSRA